MQLSGMLLSPYLVGPSSNREPPQDNQLAVVTTPNNFPLSEPETSVLSKGLNFVPIAKRTDEFLVKQKTKAIPTARQIKTFFKNLKKRIHSDEGLMLETSVFESFTVANLPYRPCG